jgi:hypothetical protein
LITKKRFNREEQRTIERTLGMQEGYVLDFSNRTIEDFFDDNFNLEFYADLYQTNGSSKAKIVRRILEVEQGHVVAQILSSLWKYRSTLPGSYHLEQADAEARLQNAYSDLVSRLSGDQPTTHSTFIAFDDSESLSVLIIEIETRIREDKWQEAIDRLHTYCMKKFRSLLDAKGLPVSQNEPLHSLAAKYAKTLANDESGTLTETILRSSISIFEELNNVRNNKSLAHDNSLIPRREARFAFDAVSAILRYLNARELP